MPYAQVHYPFENKEKFEKSFPAEFIAEGIDQTRAWFYYLHAIAVGIFDKKAFQNVIVNGIVLAEDGKKMAKKLQNYPDPTEMIEKYGADILRFYLLHSPVVRAQNLNFSEKELSEFSRGMFRMIQNSYSFFTLYASIDKWIPGEKVEAKNLLDKWILSELNMLIRDVDSAMEKYELNKATRFFPQFVDNLSNWYIRRSRKRFWKSESDEDKMQAYQTLWTVLTEFSKVLAPFAPFISEEIYRNLTDEESVHLCDFPVADKDLINEKLNEEMAIAREIVKKGLELRAREGIKVRQPLNKFSIFNFQFSGEILDIIKEELNVKEVISDQEDKEAIVLDSKITLELKLEGQMRELIRHIQQARKEADFQIDDRIEVFYEGGEEIIKEFETEISKEVLAVKLEKAGDQKPEADIEKQVKIDDTEIKFWLKK
jgi:isoleucyl-tRNA synthetase